MAKDQVADAIRYCFSSPNVCDSNLEPANPVDVIHSGLRRIAASIGDTKAYEAGGGDSLAKAVIDASENIAQAICYLADAISQKNV